MLKSLDPRQYGFIPKSCTTFALISMLNKWLTETDATGSVTRVVLLDYKKAFKLIDHKLLIAKLINPKKCKELRINFTKQSYSYEPVRINDQCLIGAREISDNPGYPNRRRSEVEQSYRKYCVKSIKAIVLVKAVETCRCRGIFTATILYCMY